MKVKISILLETLLIASLRNLGQMKCVCMIGVAALISSQGAPSIQADLIFDVVADFSGTANSETTTWSYSRNDNLNRDGSYILLPDFLAHTIENQNVSLWGTTLNSAPLIGVNDTGSPVIFQSAWSWVDNTILMHPDPDELIVISWLSPMTGTIDIDFSFVDMDTVGGNGVNWYVDLGSSSGELASGSFDSGGFSGPQSILGQTITVGDRINFIVDPKFANHNSDSTQFTATIDATATIPEPSTYALFMIILIGLSIVRRKRNSQIV